MAESSFAKRRAASGDRRRRMVPMKRLLEMGIGQEVIDLANQMIEQRGREQEADSPDDCGEEE